MPCPLALKLSLTLYFLNSVAFFTSAAVLLPPISPSRDIPLAISPPANLTNVIESPNGGIRCCLPYPHPIDPVSTRTCQSTIDRLLSYPWVDIPRTYIRDRRQRTILIAGDIGCAISLDAAHFTAEVTITLRQIVQSVMIILAVCIPYGEGGWQFLDPPRANWIVIVKGTFKSEGFERTANGTVDRGLPILAETDK